MSVLKGKQTQFSDKKKLFTETSYFSTFFGARPLRQNLLICYIHSTVAIFCIVWSKYLTSIQNDQNYCLKVKTLGKYAQVDVENTAGSHLGQNDNWAKDNWAKEIWAGMDIWARDIWAHEHFGQNDIWAIDIWARGNLGQNEAHIWLAA